MYPLNLPSFHRKTILKQGAPYIWDIVRRKYVALTPEEWVRQHVIHYLSQHLYYPRNLMRIEQTIPNKKRIAATNRYFGIQSICATMHAHRMQSPYPQTYPQRSHASNALQPYANPLFAFYQWATTFLL